jgi:hypothetical protein
MAETLVREYGLTLTGDQDDMEALVAHGFVRLSDGNVDGKLSVIQKHADLMNGFLQSELTRRGKRHTVYFDFVDEDGKKVGWSHALLGEAAFWGPDDWARSYRDGVRKMRELGRYWAMPRRRPAVRVRPYQRRR